ncbi:protein asteroid isoform X2 [Nilaparvata lugens]|nr:protein asteroid isoform X2 [Nilaparvata lugens]
MGVRGLTTFISNNDKRYLRSYKLHDTHVIIDGNSLACQLFSLRGTRVYFAFGGDYDRYAQHVKEFFQMLSQCNVKPVVVFDGGYERKKVKTVITRLQDRSAMLKHVKPASNSTPVVFPLLMRQVFRQVLLEIGVPIVQCDFEGDQEIAALGHKYNCPILSYDSDFFIYDVQYIPIPTIEHEALPLNFSLDNSSNQFCIHCKIFRVENFLNCYGGLDKSMLPMLSALLGNDYVRISVFRNFHSQMKVGKRTPGHKRVARIIEWLRHAGDFESALQKILSRMQRIHRRSVLRKIQETIKIYRCENLTVEHYLPADMASMCSSSTPESIKVNLNQMINDADMESADVEQDVSISEESSDETEESEVENNDDQEQDLPIEEKEIDIDNESMDIDDGETPPITSQVKKGLKIPDWLLDNCRKGLVDTMVIDILSLKTCFSTPQVEDKYLNPSHEISIPLLKAIIKIIFGDNKVSVSYWARNKYCSIQRNSLKPSNDDLPNLENLLEQSPESRRSLLLNLLHVPADFCIDIFPDEWKLYLCTIFYWIKNSTTPLVTEVHVKSLILCLIALNIIDSNLGFIREKLQFLKKCGKTLKRLLKIRQSDDDLSLIGQVDDDNDEEEMACSSNPPPPQPTNTITETSSHDNFRHVLSRVDVNDCIVCFEGFLKFHKLKEDLKADISLFSYPDIHAFAQFQNCLHHAMILNSLLLFPLKQCMVHKLFSGTFIYNVCSTLNCSKNTDEVLQSLLGNSPKLFEVFSTLVSAISTTTTLSAPPSKKTRTRKRKRTKQQKTENKESDIRLEENNSDDTEDHYHDENNIFSLLSSV